MSKTNRYFLHVKDIMRGYALALDYDTFRDLADSYKRYKNDNDYEVLSMHSITMETNVILPKEIDELN